MLFFLKLIPKKFSLTLSVLIVFNACARTPTASLSNVAHSGIMLVSCVGCHSSDLPSPPSTTLVPAGATQNLYEHSASYNGTSDCVSCHTSVASNVGVTWSGGTWNHTPSPTACSACHTGNAPTTTVPSTVDGFNHPLFASGTDCASCHKGIGTSWTGGVYSHSPAPSPLTCKPCHTTRNHNPTLECANCHGTIGSWSTH